jgi:hypothetical protein
MREPKGSFDSWQLSELHRIYQDICNDLHIGADQVRRDEVAAVIMDLANAGENDVAAIHQRAVTRLSNGHD